MIQICIEICIGNRIEDFVLKIVIAISMKFDMIREAREVNQRSESNALPSACPPMEFHSLISGHPVKMSVLFLFC